jgi:hypothetical protein
MKRSRSLSTMLALGVALGAVIPLAAAIPAQATACISGTGQPVLQSDIINGATWTPCDYRGFNFSGLTGDSIDFSISYMAGANFTNATFTNITIGNNTNHSMNFTSATLTGSSFLLSDLSSSDMTNATMTNMNLRYTHFDGAILNGANLTGADMTNTFLDGANLTGATVTRQQLAGAVLSPTTVCPDGYQLSVHVDDCFSALVPLTPVLSTPVITDGGFTFDVTNYNELYTYTVSCESAEPILSMGSPVGTTLPVTVSNVPEGQIVVVTVTAAIVDVTASSTTSNAVLPATGIDVPAISLTSGLALLALVVGTALGLRSRARSGVRG